MAVENTPLDSQPINSPNYEPAVDKDFNLELMDRLGEQYPNAFVRTETEAGEPVWSIRQPLHFDPIDLKSGTEWFITPDGIIGANEMVNNFGFHNIKTVLSQFRERKAQAVTLGIEGSPSFYSVGPRDNQGYSSLILFDPRKADQQTLRNFGAYLEMAEITGQRIKDTEAERQNLGLEDVMGHILSSGNR